MADDYEYEWDREFPDGVIPKRTYLDPTRMWGITLTLLPSGDLYLTQSFGAPAKVLTAGSPEWTSYVVALATAGPASPVKAPDDSS